MALAPSAARLLARIDACQPRHRNGDIDTHARAREWFDALHVAADDDATEVLAARPGLWAEGLCLAFLPELPRIGVWAQGAIRQLIARGQADRGAPLLSVAARRQSPATVAFLGECLRAPALRADAARLLLVAGTDAGWALLREHDGTDLPMALRLAARRDFSERFRLARDTFLDRDAPREQRRAALDHLLTLPDDRFPPDVVARLAPALADLLDRSSLVESTASLDPFALRPGPALIPLLDPYLRRPELRARAAWTLHRLHWQESWDLLRQHDGPDLDPDLRLEISLHDPSRAGLAALLGPSAPPAARRRVLGYLARRRIDPFKPDVLLLVERCLDDGLASDDLLVRLARHHDAGTRRRLFDRLWPLAQGRPPLPWPEVTPGGFYAALVLSSPAPDLVAILLDTIDDRDRGRALVKAIEQRPDPHLVPALERWSEANPARVTQKLVQPVLATCRKGG